MKFFGIKISVNRKEELLLRQGTGTVVLLSRVLITIVHGGTNSVCLTINVSPSSVIVFEVIPPAAYLRVTENVHHIVTFIERIIQNGQAYVTKEGNWNLSFEIMTTYLAASESTSVNCFGCR